VVLPSLLLLAYVVAWYTALRHAPAAVVTSLLSLGAPITALLTALTAPSGAAGLPDSVNQGAFLSGPAVGNVVLVLAAVILVLATWQRRPTPAHG
jgi:hypothetical protein